MKPKASLYLGLVLSLMTWDVSARVSRDEAECLALNIFHEARGESLKGQVAVAMVTLNRVKSGKYPNTICAVVYQKAQFSWTLGKRKRVKDWKAYNTVLALTHNILRGKIKHDITKGATFYHTKQVKPYWSYDMKKVVVIGQHIFYRSA